MSAFWRGYWLPVALLLMAMVFAGQSAYIHGKALVGQWLIGDAWQQTLQGSGPQKPWSWADTWPVGRLQIPELGVNQIVLAGDSGQALAFGPGHNSQSAVPGAPGMVMISGHRDTHFRFLQQLSTDHSIHLTGVDGQQRRYRVVGQEVIDVRVHQGVTINPQQDQLVLVTCWPLDGTQPDTPWRYLVFATPVATQEKPEKEQVV